MAKVSYDSPQEEKQEAVRQAIAGIREGIDTLDPFDAPFYTRYKAGFIFCEHCRQNAWVSDLTVLNSETSEWVVIRAWWHSETYMQFELRVPDGFTWKVKPHKGDMIAALIKHFEESAD